MEDVTCNVGTFSRLLTVTSPGFQQTSLSTDWLLLCAMLLN